MRERKSIFGGGGRIATAVNRSMVRNDRVFARGAVQGWAGRPGGRPLQRHSPIELRRGRCPHRPASVTRGAEERAGKSAKRRQWRMQRGDFEEVPRLAAATVAGNRLARRWATAGPYGSVTRGAMGGRPQGSPLRRGTSSTGNGPMWASAPTEGYKGVQERNPPVTASPCQPPLGKGAKDGGCGLPHQ